MDKLIMATGNRHKLAEVARMLPGVTVIPQAEAGFCEEVEETGVTFAQNAILKAEAACRALGLPALADDSGLAVDALGGEPGVYSARYCGVHGRDEDNNDLVLKKLETLPMEKRTARFVCALALARPDKPTVVVEGTVEGHIAFRRQGAGGFGYDPLFLMPDGRTLAQYTPQEKNAVSHRGRALEKMKAVLAAEGLL